MATIEKLPVLPRNIGVDGRVYAGNGKIVAARDYQQMARAINDLGKRKNCWGSYPNFFSTSGTGDNPKLAYYSPNYSFNLTATFLAYSNFTTGAWVKIYGIAAPASGTGYSEASATLMATVYPSLSDNQYSRFGDVSLDTSWMSKDTLYYIYIESVKCFTGSFSIYETSPLRLTVDGATTATNLQEGAVLTRGQFTTAEITTQPITSIYEVIKDHWSAPRHICSWQNGSTISYLLASHRDPITGNTSANGIYMNYDPSYKGKRSDDTIPITGWFHPSGADWSARLLYWDGSTWQILASTTGTNTAISANALYRISGNLPAGLTASSRLQMTFENTDAGTNNLLISSWGIYEDPR
jgi:hypothetical protein